MLFPIGDDNTERQLTPYVNYVLIAINIFVYLYQRGHPEFTSGYSVVPAEITSGHDLVGTYRIGGARLDLAPGPTPIYLTLLSSMFMHGGFMHIAGNMLYLWIFGDNVEDRLGHVRYLIFYLLCGAFAACAQTYINGASLVPMIGASGAISGVLGAYIVLFPHSRVLTIVPIVFFIQLLEVPAIVLLGLWFLMQLLSGVGTLGDRADVGGVAFWAHVAGFVAGLGFVYVFKQPERQKVEWWDGVR